MWKEGWEGVVGREREGGRLGRSAEGSSRGCRLKGVCSISHNMQCWMNVLVRCGGGGGERSAFGRQEQGNSAEAGFMGLGVMGLGFKALGFRVLGRGRKDVVCVAINKSLLAIAHPSLALMFAHAK